MDAELRQARQALEAAHQELARRLAEQDTAKLLLLAEVRNADVVIAPLEMAGIVHKAMSRLAQVTDERGAQVRMPDTAELGAAAQADGCVRFWVRDNGRGLTDADRF